MSISLGFCTEQEDVLKEMQKLQEQKESLNKLFDELSEEQRSVLEEHFQEEIAQAQKDLNTPGEQLTEPPDSKE